MMTLENFKQARKVLEGVLHPTDLIYSTFFSKSTGNHVYIKPENMQVTGAYKIRGAYFKCSTLTQEEKERGLITEEPEGNSKYYGICTPNLEALLRTLEQDFKLTETPPHL